MKNTFGNAVTVTLFGESHGESVGAVLDGVAPGIAIDEEYIKLKLAQRRPVGKISTQRVEEDNFKIISGVFNGYTTGSPLCVIVPNTQTKSGDYLNLKDIPRPSHADYTANVKYHGFQDYRGGGHFSGRITAALVAVGAILQKALENVGVFIGTHISYLHGIRDNEFSCLEDIVKVNSSAFPVLNEQIKKQMIDLIEQTASEGDSVGGVLETAVLGYPEGIGEPWFDTLESVLAHSVFSVPGVKGVEFGAGFALANMKGSQANDQFITDGVKIRTKTNNSGGINGGISNGMPILFRSAVKPTPSIFSEQQSVNITNMKAETLCIKGRHDPAIIHRVRAVVDAVTAITLSDMLTVRFGTDCLLNLYKN